MAKALFAMEARGEFTRAASFIEAHTRGVEAWQALRWNIGWYCATCFIWVWDAMPSDVAAILKRGSRLVYPVQPAK